MRFIEEWGSGLKRVNDVLEEYGLGKVAVEDTGFAVRMNVNRSNKPTDKAIGETTKNDQPANVSINDENKVTKTDVSTDGVPLNVPLNVPLTDKLVALVKNHPGINRKNLARELGVADKTVDRAISSLKEKIERRGSKKTGGYYCKK